MSQIKKKIDDIAVLIPCYNEEKTIGKVVTDFKKNLKSATIYVYDNNSTDKSFEYAKKAGAIVRKEFIQGKGNVIRRMFRDIDALCYVLVDGDDTYSAKQVKQMVDLVIKDNVDMVIGDRLSSTYKIENKRLFHNFGNDLVKNSINFLFKTNIKDIMTGYRAFSYQFVKTFPVLSKGFEIETEMTIHAIDKNMYIKNVVVDYKDRVEGSTSKLNTFTDGIIVLKTIFDMFRIYRPLAFFNIISLVLLILAIIFFIPIFITYIDIGEVPNFPTLIVCGFVVMASIQSLFVGLILDNILKKNKQDFEYKLIDCANYLRNNLQ